MVVHNPENKWNFIPKTMAIFPLFVALAFLHGDHIIFRGVSVVFFALTIYTFGFTKYERFLDVSRKVIVKRVRWLFIKTETVESIKNFEALVLSLGVTLPKSNWQSVTSTMTYDVVLVRKHASSRTHTGLGALENFLLATLLKDVNDAKDMAVSIGQQLNLPVESEKHLVRFLGYDPVETAAVWE